MAGRRVDVPDDVQRIIAKLHPETKRKVRAALEAIAEEPTVGKALGERLAGFRRIRIGRWRIVYREEGRIIEVHAVGRRATIYSDLIARLQRRRRDHRGDRAVTRR